MSAELAVGLGFLALLLTGVVLAIADNATKASEYKHDSEEY